MKREAGHVQNKDTSSSTQQENPGQGDSPVDTMSIEALQKQLDASLEGLSQEEAQQRLAQYGPNTLREDKFNPILKFLSYFWGPIPWMIEVAAILSAILQHWEDLAIILALLILNAVIGFWQEFQAANAVDELKAQLAPKARVKRNGKWVEIDAVNLVPGDLVQLSLGDIVPADVKLVEGEYLSVDQSALTGESLPVEKNEGDAAYSGSVVQQGEMTALVAATGSDTYFGRTAELVSSAGSASHFQKAVLAIGDYLIILSLILAAILIIVMIFRGSPVLVLLQFALILLVAAIPVALPAVLSMTMAIGASVLARMKTIVTRLESIEEMAGIDVLCSDKTGTLTQNKLTLGDPIVYGADDDQALILAGALASKEDSADAIDQAVCGGLEDQGVLSNYKQAEFVPFDPVRKREDGKIQDAEGNTFTVTKGAPQVIVDLCDLDEDTLDEANAKVDALAEQGYRTLGVARSDDGETWQLLGILPLYDPPREDSKETIQRAKEHGIQVKMVTGDNTAIAKQISKELGLGTNIHKASGLFKEGGGSQPIPKQVEEKVEQADGFAEVFPEHKYDIVSVLQDRGHIVGMTGDGVNDAPALKQADMGIAVSGATDAARSASDLVLTAPGLSVIVKAVEEARRIFERMNSYAIYRITETIRIMIFVVLAMTIFDFYPITTIMIILLALLNDLPIMTIAFDNTWLDPKPVRWNMRRVLTVATTLGTVGVIETFGMLLIGKMLLKLPQDQLQSLVYIKLAVAGHLTLLVVRTKRPFFSSPYPSPILLGSILGTQILAAAIVGFGLLVTRLPWVVVGYVWAYCLIWMFIEDFVKMRVYHHLDTSGKVHHNFLDLIQQPLHPHGHRREG